jgi:hypothetical protein
MNCTRRVRSAPFLLRQMALRKGDLRTCVEPAYDGRRVEGCVFRRACNSGRMNLVFTPVRGEFLPVYVLK